MLRVIKNLELVRRNEARLWGRMLKNLFILFLSSQTHAFSSQLRESLFSPGTRAENLWVFWMPIQLPHLPRESPSSSHLASAYSAALAPAFTLSIQPNADSSFLTSYMLPRHFSVLVISSVLSLSTSLPSPVAPWGPTTLSSCLYHGDGCY